MKGLFIAVVVVAGALAAGCQSSDSNAPAGGAGTPSSVGNGQTRNNGPFAPDSNPPTTQPANHY